MEDPNSTVAVMAIPDDRRIIAKVRIGGQFQQFVTKADTVVEELKDELREGGYARADEEITLMHQGKPLSDDQEMRELERTTEAGGTLVTKPIDFRKAAC